MNNKVKERDLEFK